MSEANLQTEWAALLFKSLADAGVRDIVISPGSRSTPFVVAAVREPRLVRHDAIDERAASFFALGQARVTGRPSVLLCTSGTAPAHYLPAMIEANITGTPMIILSSDRPHELYDCNAPQTIDQVKLFGEHARQFFDLVPEASADALRALRRSVSQAVLASRWPRAGAVHMNARARKPLEPAVAKNAAEEAFAALARGIGNEPVIVTGAPRLSPAPEAVSAAAALAGAARRGLIVAGPAAITQRAARDAVWELARASGFAVACEATSQLRFAPKPAGVHVIDAFELLLRSKTFRDGRPFDFAFQIGAPPTSGPWEQVAPGVPRVVIAERGWPDPHGTARVMMFGDVALSVTAVAAALRARETASALDTKQQQRMLAMNDLAWTATEGELSASEPLVEAVAVRALVDKAPDGSLLVLSNSLTVRLVDIYQRAIDRDLEVLSQRGASGIDGLVAGAAGAATSAARPLAIAIGDVSLLHDLTSLGLAARVRTPLVVFLLHNGGGRIFEQLPIVDVPGIERAVVDHATTPHDTDFAPAAALYGLRHERVTTEVDVRAALDRAYAHAGCTLIEVRVEPSGAIAISRRVTAAVEAAIAKAQREEAT
jgi:2-succinyl-5-enolpyruvyl-6-hydroxy-3-cyclohexene-1-carboxylate synthase